MSIVEIVITSIALAMDAFAVSICKGLSIRKIKLKDSLIIGGYFGLFQGIMPLIGFFLAYNFKDFIDSIDHWIAFILLVIIGINMVIESFSKSEVNNKLDFKTMIMLAIATSIDALAVGITFAFLEVDILLAVILIAGITFIISLVGVKIGSIFGNKYESKAKISGGIVLILIGVKILIEHIFM